MIQFTCEFNHNANNHNGKNEERNKESVNKQDKGDFVSVVDPYVTFHYTSSNSTVKDEEIKAAHYEDENTAIVFDGEIYNDKELRKKVQKEEIELSTTANAELIAALFKLDKEETFKQIRGKFAVVIYDKVEKVLIGARDYFGIKPLFYTENSDGIVLTSDKKSAAHFLGENKINQDSLQHYLSFQFVPEPMTMTKEIKKIEPAHYFIIKKDEPIQFKQYWQANFNPMIDEKNNFIRRIQDVLYDSVSAHLRGDLTVGSLLSGGIDSTIVVSLAKQIDPNIKTFSVGFEREGFSEVDVAKETADKLDVENISYLVTAEEYMESLPKIMWHMNDPLADPSCVPLYFVTKEARKHVGAVLSGEGSDELFGGYNIYREPNSLKMFHSIPGPINQMLGKIATILPEGVRGKSFLERGTTPLRERYIGNAKMFEEAEKAQILKHYNPNLSYQQITAPFFDQVHDYSLVNQMQYVDIHTWLRGDIMLKASQMTMANDLELRSPFLDKNVFHVASEIPVDLKIANGTTKSILREASRGIIPDHVLNRKKLGFPVPIRHWLKDELNSWAKRLIQESETDHLLYKSYVLNLLDAHCQGKGDYSRKIWTLLMFMLWHQIFVENKYSFAEPTEIDKHSNKNDHLILV